MSQMGDDEYADLQAYIQQVGMEIDDVISGRLPRKRSLQEADVQLSCKGVRNGQASSAFVGKADEVKAMKPPKGSIKESRGSRNKGEGSERKKAGKCFDSGWRRASLGHTQAVRGRDGLLEDNEQRTMESCRRSLDHDWRVSGVDDLCVVEGLGDKDVLLENILNNEGRKRLRPYHSSLPEVNSLVCNSSVDYATQGSSSRGKHLKDLNKLLLYDRNSLLLGSNIETRNKSNVSTSSNGRDKNVLKNVLSSHHCSHPRHHHKHHGHHRHTDPGVDSPQEIEPYIERRHSSQSCHHIQNQHNTPSDSSSSGKDPLDELRQERRSELLTKIYEDVKRANRPLSPEQLKFLRLAQLQLTSSPTVLNHNPSLPVDDVDSDISNPRNSADVQEEDMSASDRSATDSELRDLFDLPTQKPITIARGRLSRKSYSNDDNPIISPPPGFGSPNIEEMAKATRSEVDLRTKADQIQWPEDISDNNATSPVQYYAVPFDFEITPELPSPSASHTTDNFYLPNSSPLTNEPKTELTTVKISQKDGCQDGIMQLSGSSQEEALDLARSWISSCSEKSEEKDCGYINEFLLQRHEIGLLSPENSTTRLSPNEGIHELIFTANEEAFKPAANVLTPTEIDWSSSKSKFSGPAYSQKSEKSTGESEHTKQEIGNHKNVEDCYILDLYRSSENREDLKELDLQKDTDLNLLIDVGEDNNNNTNINILSMCLASDCKHLSSQRSQKVPQPLTQPQSNKKDSEKNRDIGESDKYPLKTFSISKSLDASLESRTHETQENFRSTSKDFSNNDCSSVVETTSTFNHETDETIEQIESLRNLKSINEYDLVGTLELTANNSTRPTTKATLRDTAIQTSLELDGYVVDISEKLNNQNDIVREASARDLVMKSENTIVNIDSASDIVMDSEKCMDFEMVKKLKCNNNDVQRSNSVMCEYDKGVEESKKDNFIRSPRVSFLRSKSIHGSGRDVDEDNGRRYARPDVPSLSGSLRELSHLNIDVSQKLVDGEQRFVVTNGSPELQVMVNALTPVLSRRNRARNARRLQNVTPEEDVVTGNFIQNASARIKENIVVNFSESFRNEEFSKIKFNNSECDHEDNSLPLYARLRSYEGSCSSDEFNDIHNLNKNGPPYKNGQKEKNQVYQRSNKKLSQSTKQNSRSVSPSRQGETEDQPAFDVISVDGIDLDEELQKSRTSLFLSPKLAHTWHGASSTSANRPFPRMGVRRTQNDGISNASGSNKKVTSNVLTPKPLSPTPAYFENAYTMPVISRTLLDALHKRYCAHQYSSHYQTVQPVSLLKLDHVLSSGKQTATALLVEPRKARDHEVQAAPPSPEVLTRLRLLNTAKDSNRDKDADNSAIKQAPQEQLPSFSPRPDAFKESLFQKSLTKQLWNQGEVNKASKGDHLQGFRHRVTPDSSPNLRDKLNHNNKHHAELEAAEALKWLRAAGFPQYAQMFEDGQFPVDMGVVEKDHDFLDKDSLQSLFRRLETLNKYAGIRLGAHPVKKATSEEDDEDDFCALSERWEYQKSVRRWSRKDLSPSSIKSSASENETRELAARSGSHDSLLADQDSGSQTGDSPLLDSKMPHQNVVQPQRKHEMAYLSLGGHPVAEVPHEDSEQTDSAISPRLRRAASEKIKTAKNIFKKMEGFKSTKSRRHHHHRNIVEISGPFVADKESMQAKLDRLNCVDISPTSDSSTNSPTIPVKGLDNGKHGSSSGTAGTPNIKHSPQSPPPASSPRPHSDLMLRPREQSHPHPSSNIHTRSSHTHQIQHSSLSHDSSFDEYYQAQNTFLHNLQSSQAGTTEGARRNNSETNLMEIFLVPQDHQPGRFPRMLQNGYIETEACGTAVNARTGSVRLGRGTGLTSNSSASPRMALPSSGRGFGYRVSVYDNFLPSEGKRQEEGVTPSAIPGITELKLPSPGSEAVGYFSRESSQNRNVEVNYDSSQPGNTDTSRDSSVVRMTESASDQDNRSSTRERSVESSSSSHTPQEGTLTPEPGFSSTESRSSRKSSPDSISSKSRGVTHSSSVDSYFRGNSSHSDTSVSDNTENTAAVAFQKDYDEFDRILQELYQNINDLTSFMDKDKSEKTPKLIRAATSPLPESNNNSHSPLHVSSPSSRPVLRSQKPVDDPSSPSSATSDLVPSPASPSSPQDPNESFYRALELDHENSSSGGEGSNTAESSGEDQEAVLTDVSHDDSLDQVIEVSRERRDSGVGHSLTRAPNDRRRKKIRWHSFQKSHRPDVTSRAMQINSLNVGQLVRLQKLSLLKLTGIMEKCLPVNKSGWNWMVPRFMKRQKVPDFSDKSVFGVPLSVMAQRTGQPLPQCVLYAMRYLRRTCQSAVGIFRKSGVKSKIQQLRDHLEAHPDMTNFEGENAYNVADMLKTYFRDLPECLLTNKMSETFRSIYTYVPPSQRLEAIQAAILLLPDENREVLQSILLFLSDIASHEADHQMNASNLAVCFTPTVFHLGPRQSVPYSPKRNRKNSSGVPDPREILEQKAAHECLLMMITECKKLFTVPSNLFRQLQVQSLARTETTLPQDIFNSPADVKAFGQEKIQMVLKEAHDKNRGWIPTMTIGDVEIFHRKPMDDCPLKEWKLVVEIEAPPIEVLRRIMHERHTWDEDLLSWSVVERLDPYSDVFQYVLNSMAPHPPRNFCVLRYWRSDLTKGACALITMSVEHSDALEIQGVWATDLGTYFLMEPCGSGRSRLMYITRVDTRGRMPEWYSKIFGHISANFLERLKESFKQDMSGPETKV